MQQFRIYVYKKKNQFNLKQFLYNNTANFYLDNLPT